MQELGNRSGPKMREFGPLSYARKPPRSRCLHGSGLGAGSETGPFGKVAHFALWGSTLENVSFLLFISLARPSAHFGRVDREKLAVVAFISLCNHHKMNALRTFGGSTLIKLVVFWVFPCHGLREGEGERERKERKEKEKETEKETEKEKEKEKGTEKEKEK